MPDFPHDIVEQVGHRPWPMPDEPWIMTQSWHDLLFAHWPVEVEALRTLVPPELELDRFDDRAWISIVPFRMSNVAPRGIPSLPGLSAFPELNVRTYVRVGDRPGVHFFSLDAGNALAVSMARKMFGLPYFHAEMTVVQDAPWVTYSSERHAPPAQSTAQFTARYRPVGPVFEARPGTLDYFLTERYCLYTVAPDARVRRLEIHHPAWQLQTAEAEIAQNTMAGAAGIALPATAPHLHFAARQDVIAFAPHTVQGNP